LGCLCKRGIKLTTTQINKQLITSGIIGKKKKAKLGVVSTICLAKRHDARTNDELVIPIHGTFKNRPERIVEILKVIDLELENGYAPLLIHCKNGEDRSPTMAALYLFYKGKFDDFDGALNYVKGKNASIKPKTAFVSFIQEQVLHLLDSEENGKSELHKSAREGHAKAPAPEKSA
jgi:protein-tyrosine phosphatase